MADVRDAEYSVADTLRRHVLRPVTTAEADVESELAEVRAEREMFEQFGKRVAAVETVTTPEPTTPATQTTFVDSRSRAVDRVRSAFRETVMSVDHYDEVYGESLVEHAAAELSADVAAGFARETAAPFSELYKSTLTSAVQDAVDDRDSFCDLLEAERDSLGRAEAALEEMLDDCDGVSVPTRDRGGFQDRLDDIARDRQETVQRRVPGSRTDGHDLCTYLYRDRDWTYPVLTAVARFRTAVL